MYFNIGLNISKRGEIIPVMKLILNLIDSWRIQKDWQMLKVEIAQLCSESSEIWRVTWSAYEKSWKMKMKPKQKYKSTCQEPLLRLRYYILSHILAYKKNIINPAL